ncbi:MAG: 2TM domain-containing protein [Promethearchaeota archaeon]
MNKPELINIDSNPAKPKPIKVSSVHKVLLALHLFSYSAVMALLILIWALSTEYSIFWPVFPLLGWGIAIGLHLIAYLLYFDKSTYLTRITEQSTFRILFVFHAFIFIMVNLIILYSDFITPSIVYFYWPLSMWGIGIAYHATGFFSWNKLMENEKAKITRKYPEYEERKIKIIGAFKISNLWILIAHITYFIVVNILIYTVIPNLFTNVLENMIFFNVTISWSTFISIHIFGFFLYFYNESIKPVLKGLIIHVSLYVASNVLFIYQWIKSQLPYFTPIYSLILWGIIIAFHAFLSLRYEYMIKDALPKVEKYYPDADRYKLHSKARGLLLWKYSLISHLIIYITGIFLIAINMIIMSIELSNIIHPIMGWGIGVSIHVALYLNVLLKIKAFWKWTFSVHLATYISTGVYLIILNVMMGGLPWSAIALVGWGIGLGVHALLAFIR